MKRRIFLTGAVAITLAEFLAGCETQADLKVKLLKNSIPAQMMSKFRGELTSPYNNLSFKPIENLTELFSMLQDWQRKLLLEKQQSSINKTENINIANLVTLGDYWLANAINLGMTYGFCVERLYYFLYETSPPFPTTLISIQLD